MKKKKLFKESKAEILEAIIEFLEVTLYQKKVVNINSKNVMSNRTLAYDIENVIQLLDEITVLSTIGKRQTTYRDQLYDFIEFELYNLYDNELNDKQIGKLTNYFIKKLLPEIEKFDLRIIKDKLGLNDIDTSEIHEYTGDFFSYIEKLIRGNKTYMTFTGNYYSIDVKKEDYTETKETLKLIKDMLNYDDITNLTLSVEVRGDFLELYNFCQIGNRIFYTPAELLVKQIDGFGMEHEDNRILCDIMGGREAPYLEV